MAMFEFGQSDSTVKDDLLLGGQRENLDGLEFKFSSLSQPQSVLHSFEKQVTVTESTCSRLVTPIAKSGFSSAPPTPPRNPILVPKTRPRIRQKPIVRLPPSPSRNGQVSTLDAQVTHISAAREDKLSGNPNTSPKPTAFSSSQSLRPTVPEFISNPNRALNPTMISSFLQSRVPEKTSTAKSQASDQETVLSPYRVCDDTTSSHTSSRDSKALERECPTKNPAIVNGRPRQSSDVVLTIRRQTLSEYLSSRHNERSIISAPGSSTVASNTTIPSAQRPITPEPRRDRNAEDSTASLKSSVDLGGLHESTVGSNILTKSDVTKASETSVVTVSNTGSSVSLAASRLSNLPPLFKYRALQQNKTLTVNESRVLLENFSLKVKAEKYAAGVLKSWIPDDVSLSTLVDLTNVLARPLPSIRSDDAYIYVYCEAASCGYVESDTGDPLPIAQTLVPTLPRFWRADGETLSLKDALLDKPVNLSADEKPHITPAKVKKPPYLKIKIGYTQKDLGGHLAFWRDKCKKDIMLLMVYDFNVGIGPLTNPTPVLCPGHELSFIDDSRGGDQSPARYATVDLSQVPITARGVPYGPTVETLVRYHLERERKERRCTCGAKHQELFEFPATVEYIQKVDTSIRRWVAWAKDREARAIHQQSQAPSLW